MNNQELYNHIISLLKEGKRPQVQLNDEQKASLNQAWQTHLDSENHQELTKVLCVLDNTLTLCDSFSPVIYRSLEVIVDSDMQVMILGVARRHIIDHAHKKGERVPYDFIKVLEKKLSSNDPEVLEWTLRLIESLGNQSIILKESVLKAKPGMSALFNNHKKAAKQIVELLEKRWTR